MYEDVEADFWKQILITMQQKNMTRFDGEPLYFDGAAKAFDEFSKKHPGIKASFEMSSSYATCEMEISATIKLRLFIQSQIKGTLLQQNGTDFIKIADAKFPNNPFTEIEFFFEHKGEYLKQLAEIKSDSVKNNKKQQVAKEFLTAYVEKKYPDSISSIESAGDGFILSLEIGGTKTQKHIPLDQIVQCRFDF